MGVTKNGMIRLYPIYSWKNAFSWHVYEAVVEPLLLLVSSILLLLVWCVHLMVVYPLLIPFLVFANLPSSASSDTNGKLLPISDAIPIHSKEQKQ